MFGIDVDVDDLEEKTCLPLADKGASNTIHHSGVWLGALGAFRGPENIARVFDEVLHGLVFLLIERLEDEFFELCQAENSLLRREVVIGQTLYLVYNVNVA